ncbi:dynamin family protein [Argonema antarcticum]|uniref:dynamin family protein n=1 Tax=Argonema antarcticum TaxID=2942763 RepID=UPI0020122D7C|nr:dynamin family protein [Argonema antarcticum]MCL1469272.1 dynamin family protein [Argonema antarcticum A004/B2]
MDTSLVKAETVELLSRITGQKLNQEDITPPVIFLAVLITVLLGVIKADNQVTDEEKQRLQVTINKFIPTEGNIRELTKVMFREVSKDLDFYKKPTQLVKLTGSFSKSEKLLLISFGYEIAAADGSIDAPEKKYLEIIADWLGIKASHLSLLETAFSRQENLNATALDEVKLLLDPARFHDLDTIFVKAANDILESLIPKSQTPESKQELNTPEVTTKVEASASEHPEPPRNQPEQASAYQKLQEFQKKRQQLDNLCYQIFRVIQDCSERDLLPDHLKQEIEEISKKLQSQRFRLAVVGEFSQGKSTLLNALVREKIQPVRAIPCSGTVTVLKYGTKKRVICRYKNGREEEIAIDEYKEKAAIPKESAQTHRSNELERCEIEEIVFEHPDLDLCRNGVEILDSPGLNEHPERTAITQKLLKETDAAIFLTNAMHLLPEKEKELIEDVRFQLNNGKDHQPVENLFILVNFMDLLDEEEDRKDVVNRLETFVKKRNLLVTGSNRIHYISAKAALKAILEGNEDEYHKSFQNFTQSIENFLTLERGNLKIKQSVKEIQNLIQESLAALQQAEDVLDGKLKLSEAERQQVLEQIGEASGRDFKINLLANKLLAEVSEPTKNSWDQWLDGLENRLKQKCDKWTSEYSAIWSRDQLARDCASKFNEDLSAELDNWIDNQLKKVVLKQPLEALDRAIEQELKAIVTDLEAFNQKINISSPNWVYFNQQTAPSATSGEWFFGSLGMAGLAVALIPVIIVAGPLMTIIASVSAVVTGGAGIRMLVGGVAGIIKGKVFEFGYQQFINSKAQVFEKINSMVSSTFEQRVKEASEKIAKTISSYENILEQQEKAHKETQQQRDADKAFIAQKCQELEQVQRNIESILAQVSR